MLCLPGGTPLHAPPGVNGVFRLDLEALAGPVTRL
jgi:hypothetical protein